MGVIVRVGVPTAPDLRRKLRRAAQRALQALGEASAELGVTLVGDVEMRELNRTYRGRDRATDVLAFAMREGRRVPGDGAVLGDVVISVETAARQARGRRVSLAAETQALLVHGILHLLGYDHERSRVEAGRMRAMERRLRVLLGTERGGRRTAPPTPHRHMAEG
jgi:probable rRNA maturation factor